MASIIKSNNGGRTAQPQVFRFEDAAAQAGDGTASVQAKNAAIIAEAEQQADVIRRRAAEEGLQTAQEEIAKQVDRKLEAILPIVRQAATELADARQAWLRRWEQSAVQLAIKIANRVVRREIAHSPQIAIGLVREALELAAGATQIKIRMHPADFATMESQVKSIAQEISRSAHTTVVSDETISRGGCRLETQQGTIDQQIETQLDRIASELMGAES